MNQRIAVAVLACASLVVTATTFARAEASVHVRTLRFVDRSRQARFSDGTSGPRVLITTLRYPARGKRPFPLIVFAHGFALLPSTYRHLLDTWTRAGYVVASPTFPVESADAHGGASRNDLANEPGDLTFVLSRLLAPASPVRGLISPQHIAFAGQSDGGVAAFAATYQHEPRDQRVDAAIILSGAPLGAFAGAPPGAPPLLAVQGTADPFNSPATTAAYFRLAPRPKFLLWLLGASHRQPYTTDKKYLAIVEQTTIAFLGHYLRNQPLPTLTAIGNRAGASRLVAEP